MRVNCLLNLTVINGDGAVVTLVTDTIGSYSAVQDGDDRFSVRVINESGAGTGASIVISKPGYKDINHRLEFGSTMIPEPGLPWPCIPSAGAWELINETLESEFNLSPIYCTGKSLVRDGNYFHPLYVTGFDLIKLFAEGQDITPFLQWAQQVAHGVRIFSYWQGVFGPYPRNVYESFFKFATRYCYLEPTIHAGARLQFSDATAELDFANMMYDIMRSYSNIVFPELVNEGDQTNNSLANPNDYLIAPSGFNICSRGSNGADQDPAVPVYSVAGFHPARSDDWYRKPHNAWESANKLNIAVGNDEMNRPDLDNYNVSHFKQAGTVSALMSAWTTSHSATLRDAVIPNGPELDCVLAVLDGAKRVPAGTNLLRYTRNDLGSPLLADNYLRVYCMIDDANGKGYGAVLDEVGGLATNVRTEDGWRITKVEDCYYELEKI